MKFAVLFCSVFFFCILDSIAEEKKLLIKFVIFNSHSCNGTLCSVRNVLSACYLHVNCMQNMKPPDSDVQEMSLKSSDKFSVVQTACTW